MMMQWSGVFKNFQENPNHSVIIFTIISLCSPYLLHLGATGPSWKKKESGWNGSRNEDCKNDEMVWEFFKILKRSQITPSSQPNFTVKKKALGVYSENKFQRLNPWLTPWEIIDLSPFLHKKGHLKTPYQKVMGPKVDKLRNTKPLLETFQGELSLQFSPK